MNKMSKKQNKKQKTIKEQKKNKIIKEQKNTKKENNKKIEKTKQRKSNKNSNMYFIKANFTIKLSIYLMFHSIIQAKLSKEDVSNISTNKLNSSNSEHTLIITVESFKTNYNKIENNANKTKQAKRNKKADTINRKKEKKRKKR